MTWCRGRVLVCVLVAGALRVAAASPDGGVARESAWPDGGGVLGASDGGELGPAQWRLALKLSPDSGLREGLIVELGRAAPRLLDGGSRGEVAVSRARVNELLDDPRAQLVYGEKTVSIVAPSMKARHRKEHLDLMKLFLVPERLAAAENFIGQHSKDLEKARATWGVDPEVVVAILMWESKLGTITGDYLAFNAFTSQAFFIDEASAVALSRPGEKAHYEPVAHRARVEKIRARARSNLVALIRQCEAKGIDPLGVKGSWAGALGFPQFMPASLRWADDGDGDGKIDLFSFPDAIASVARYLAQHGYQTSRKRAVWEYNNEDAYVLGVLAFADQLSANLKLRADGGTAPSPDAAVPSPR